MKNKILDFIKKTDIMLLMMPPSLLPIALLIVWGGVVDRYLKHQDIEIYNYFVLLIGLAIAGFNGLFQFIKREAPGMIIPIKGNLAIISGILLMLIFWGSGIVTICFLFIKLF